MNFQQQKKEVNPQKKSIHISSLLNKFIRGPCLANSSKTSFTLGLISECIYIKERPSNHSFVIVLLKQFFNFFIPEKLLSHSQLVMGRVIKIFKA